MSIRNQLTLRNVWQLTLFSPIISTTTFSRTESKVTFSSPGACCKGDKPLCALETSSVLTEMSYTHHSRAHNLTSSPSLSYAHRSLRRARQTDKTSPRERERNEIKDRSVGFLSQQNTGHWIKDHGEKRSRKDTIVSPGWHLHQPPRRRPICLTLNLRRWIWEKTKWNQFPQKRSSLQDLGVGCVRLNIPNNGWTHFINGCSQITKPSGIKWRYPHTSHLKEFIGDTRQLLTGSPG